DPISVEDYMCNLIAGREKIAALYHAVDKAREIRGRGGKFCYVAKFSGVGFKTYNGGELLRLDDRACCASLARLLTEADGAPTIEQYILILLKLRNPVRQLYQTRYRSLFIKSQAKVFCYTFVNPLEPTVVLVGRTKTFKSAINFLNFFCECEKTTFVPLSVLG
ncbi:unnamed protein product, partial [marine sediment metagenome]